ncbi:accessory factor UbiK family protein [Aestuariirhabdus sp. Z084]|uniref:accessory factor UbiK family protein n=1 Tax=Aestuariirhabdus haliotis TaxID=2918751 RepID=UPI00201B394E|nr:accessory factor UbiK family protein [Aestuariirhabdus haliotis]MCL6417633.1 accessory factor UbiK family protein [Aestuariirhabdus haliotis]MCL6421559.1 accessory factor UbiK family protein [Aestuariirhabdus haliotis]
MIDKLFIAGLSRQAAQILSGDKSQFHQDAEQKLQLLLQNAFGKLNLVSRDEFDTQAAVLARTRERLEALEKRYQQLVDDLEKKDDPKGE